MKKSFLLTICAVALVFGVSSCGGNSNDNLDVVTNVGCVSDSREDISAYCDAFELVSASPVTVMADDDFGDFYYHFHGNMKLKKIKDIDSLPNKELESVVSYCNENGVVLYSMRYWSDVNILDLAKMDIGSEKSYDYEFQGPKMPTESWLKNGNGHGTIITGKEADDLLKDVKLIKVEIVGIRN